MNYTPLKVAELQKKFQKKPSVPVDIILIVIGLITTLALVTLVFMLYQKNIGL